VLKRLAQLGSTRTQFLRFPIRSWSSLVEFLLARDCALSVVEEKWCWMIAISKASSIQQETHNNEFSPLMETKQRRRLQSNVVSIIIYPSFGIGRCPFFLILSFEGSKRREHCLKGKG
jgi:hypothetical protein